MECYKVGTNRSSLELGFQYNEDLFYKVGKFFSEKEVNSIQVFDDRMFWNSTKALLHFSKQHLI